MATIAFVTIRKLSATEPTLRIVSYFAIVGLFISAIPLIWTWQTPTIRQCWMLMGVGLTTTIGQLLLTRGYQNAPAASVGIFYLYFSTFWHIFRLVVLERAIRAKFFFGCRLN
jgi:drug/metabolite transporter (DMT)-like permease